MESWMTSGTAVRELSFEELERKFQPLISKYSFHRGDSRYAKGGIAGYEVEDFEQELRIVLFNCQRSFSPETKTGYSGKPSSFVNFFIHAVENRLGKLRAASDKYHKPITQLQCTSCQTVVPVQGRTKCPKCGGRRWDYRRGSPIMAIEELLQDPPDEDQVFEGAEELLAELPPSLAEVAIRLLRDESVSAKEKRSLKRFGARNDLPPEFSYQQHLRVRSAS